MNKIEKQAILQYFKNCIVDDSKEELSIELDMQKSNSWKLFLPDKNKDKANWLEWVFGHIKAKIDLSFCKNLKDVEKVIKNYILYYNNNRFQWNKKKMTPIQYRNHLENL